ncbi:MAG: ArnT family glycosyltransferase, partial [Flavobacteriales bacterium]
MSDSYFTPTRSSSRMRHRSRRRPRAAAQREGSALRWLGQDIRDALSRHAKRTSKAHKAFVAAIIAAGALLRAWPLGEAITAPEAAAYLNFIARPFAAIVTDYSLPTNHVLHSLLAKASIAVFGIHHWSLRLPAFLASVLVLPLLYLLTRTLFNRYIALMATAMVAGLPQMIEVGSLANGYSITWAAMLAAMLFGRHVVRESNPWSAAIMGALLALGMWSVPSMIYPATTVVLWTLFSFLGKYKRSLVERITVLAITVAVFFAATVLLYLP